jgi:Kef-type K+ transport system membrane component KefB
MEVRMTAVELAAVLSVAVVAASVISVEVGISVALLELGLGVLAGNLLNLDANADWLVFIAGFASIVLTFLAGAEVDPDDFRERLGASLAIGLVSFVGPFVVAALIALGPLGWSLKASLIAGTALSTTSLAVVYAVLVETGLNETRVGKLLMSTGLTFGTISSLYGLNAGIIDRTQFSLLVTVVVLSAIVPTAIAQRRFSPDVEAEHARSRPGPHPHATAVPAGEHA